jgi:hypothetical protein
VTFIVTNITRKLHACFQYTNTYTWCNKNEKYYRDRNFYNVHIYTSSHGAVQNRDISRSSYNPFAWITLFHNPVFSYKKVSLERWLTTQGETVQTWSLPAALKGETEHDKRCVVQPTYRPTISTETYLRTNPMNSYCFCLVCGRCRVQIMGGAPKSLAEIFQRFYNFFRANSGTVL